MTFQDLVIRNRSYRRFDESDVISMETLTELVNLARRTASAANLQPLKYIVSNAPETNAAIFPSLGWAAYLKKWPGPGEGERPTGYIVVLADTEIAKNVDCDHGIASQTILLGAVEKGYGGCMLGAINRDKIREALEIPERYVIKLVLALGKPAEVCELGEVGDDEDIKYFRDDNDHHIAPKRRLDDIIIAKHESS